MFVPFGNVSTLLNWQSRSIAQVEVNINKPRLEITNENYNAVSEEIFAYYSRTTLRSCKNLDSCNSLIEQSPEEDRNDSIHDMSLSDAPDFDLDDLQTIEELELDHILAEEIKENQTHPS